MHSTHVKLLGGIFHTLCVFLRKHYKLHNFFGVCLNVAGRDSRVEVAGAGAGAGKGRG